MFDKIEIKDILDIARNAGKAVLEVYNQDFDVQKKEDRSPITLADKRSNDIISQGLREAYPDTPIISEESKQVPYEERKNWDYFWMIDPLDGTKEFIKKNDEFTINIALLHKDTPVLGVVYVPVMKTLYYAAKGKGAFKVKNDKTDRLSVEVVHYSKKNKVKVVASRSHLTDEVKAFVSDLEQSGKEVDFLSAGSSLKICLVAENKADVYPRFGPTMEWDTAAADIVAREAGRQVLQAKSRQPVVYNKEDLLNPWFIVE